MSQIHTQWSHFWRLLVTVDFDDSFNTKVWSVDYKIIAIYINGVCYMGVFRNVPNSRAVVTLLEAVGYFWFWWWFQHKSMFSWSYNHCCIYQWCGLYGVFRNVANSRAVVTLFGGDWLLWILMMFHYKYTFRSWMITVDFYGLWTKLIRIIIIELLYMGHTSKWQRGRGLWKDWSNWTICVKLVLPGLQIDSKADHNLHANWYWWKYVFYAITLAIYGSK